MFSSSRHKREQNGCFEEKKKCSLLTRTSIILKNVKNIFAQGWSLCLIHPFTWHVIAESECGVRFYPRLLSTPITRKRKSPLPSWSLLSNARKQTRKMETHTQLPTVMNTMRKIVLPQVFSRKAFSKVMIFELTPEWREKASLGRFRRQNFQCRRNGKGNSLRMEMNLVYPKIRPKVVVTRA